MVKQMVLACRTYHHGLIVQIFSTQIAKEVVQAKSKLLAVVTMVFIAPLIHALKHLVECRGWEAFLEAPDLSNASMNELAAITYNSESKVASKQLHEQGAPSCGSQCKQCIQLAFESLKRRIREALRSNVFMV